MHLRYKLKLEILIKLPKSSFHKFQINNTFIQRLSVSGDVRAANVQISIFGLGN